MSSPQPRYSPEETARRGDELYEQQVRAQVEPGNQGKVVAIDVHTGAFHVADTALEAAKGLRGQHPDAEVWFVRIGHRALHRLGSRPAGGRP
jgi:hypothetical protein